MPDLQARLQVDVFGAGARCYSNGKPLHIVFADNQDDDERIVITVYRPDPALWADDFATRKPS